MLARALNGLHAARRYGGLVALAFLLAAAGCGGAKPAARMTTAELARGRVLFQTGASEGCSFCHTLAAAESQGVIGPNLDNEMRESGQRKKTDEQLRQYVLGRIEQGECLDSTDASRCMPPHLFSGADADAVAAFVAICGRSPGHTGCAPTPPRMSAPAYRGELLFATRGCSGCHYSAGGRARGPQLIGLAGSKVALADGRTIVANEAYLTRSIAAPDSDIVAGYPSGLMASIVDKEGLTRAQIDALVAYIETLKP